MQQPNDLKGMKFGRLFVLHRAEPNATIKNRGARWVCLCDCGNESVVRSDAIKRGTTVSCGCLSKENASRMFTTHGMTDSPEYRAYWNMRKRCYDSTTRHFKNYGGRGIAVCPEWLESVNRFLADMGRKPDPKFELDRIDNDKGYSPENCRWTSKAENNANRRVTRRAHAAT